MKVAKTGENPIEIDHQSLSPEALLNIIESFILREGTDYGAEEMSLATKVQQIRRQLEKSEIKIYFDQATQTVSLVKHGKSL